MKKIIKIAYAFVLFTPALVLGAPRNFKEVVDFAIDIISLLIPLVASVALLAFFWGIAKFVGNAGNEDKIEEGKQLMFWGAIALFAMFSIWGLVAFVVQILFPGQSINIIPVLSL